MNQIVEIEFDKKITEDKPLTKKLTKAFNKIQINFKDTF